MMSIVLVGVAGGTGSLARFAVGRLLGTSQLPWATLVVNLLGSCLLAWLYTSFRPDSAEMQDIDWRLIVGTGFCGGFTTYSAFNYEIISLAQQAGFAKSGAYLALTVVGCIVAGLVGIALASK